MVRHDVAARKVARASAWLDDAEAIFERPAAELDEDAQARDVATFYLFLAIQEAIDLAAHWVADAGWSPPEESGATFDLLADRGAITRELAEEMRGATGLRNRIAHGYLEIDHERIHREFRRGAGSVRCFLELVATEAGI